MKLLSAPLRALRWRWQRRMLWKQFQSEYDMFVGDGPGLNGLPIRWTDRLPCLEDRNTGAAFDRHYFYHLAWATRVLRDSPPSHHTDISSHHYFAGIASAFFDITFCEFGPLSCELPGLDVAQVDLRHLPFESASIPSLSCMHVLEHVGLGRYGDDLDVDGDARAAKELVRVLSNGGQLLLVVPVGRPRVMFNGQRIYSYDSILRLFDGLCLGEFALIPDHPDQGHLIRHADPALVASQDCACGCFNLTK